MEILHLSIENSARDAKAKNGGGSVLQCVAAWCVRESATIISIRDAMSPATHCITQKHTATRCSNLHHTAAYCNALQHTATHCNALQHTATHCNTLRHTATHCDILQHTATHCNAWQRTATAIFVRDASTAPMSETGRLQKQWLIQFLKNHLCDNFIQ